MIYIYKYIVQKRMFRSFLTLKKNAAFFYIFYFCEICHFCMTYETKKSTVLFAFFYYVCKRTQRMPRSFIKNIKERHILL